MHAMVTEGKDFILVGSVRDDGPLPDVYTDVIEGQRAMRESLEAYDTARFGSLNRQFHELLCSRCDDERLMGMVHQEWLRMDIIRRSAFWYAPGRAVASIAEHEAIIDLIEAGADPDLVETEARQHEVRTLTAVLDHDAAQAATDAPDRA